MNNAVLVVMEGARPEHRFCTDAEGREILATVAKEGGDGTLLIAEGADVELVYLLCPELREKVTTAKTNLKASYRFKAALDKEKVPMDRDLRMAIHRAFGHLGAMAM